MVMPENLSGCEVWELGRARLRKECAIPSARRLPSWSACNDDWSLLRHGPHTNAEEDELNDSLARLQRPLSCPTT